MVARVLVASSVLVVSYGLRPTGADKKGIEVDEPHQKEEETPGYNSEDLAQEDAQFSQPFDPPAVGGGKTYWEFVQNRMPQWPQLLPQIPSSCSSLFKTATHCGPCVSKDEQTQICETAVVVADNNDLDEKQTEGHWMTQHFRWGAQYLVDKCMERLPQMSMETSVMDIAKKYYSPLTDVSPELSVKVTAWMDKVDQYKDAMKLQKIVVTTAIHGHVEGVRSRVKSGRDAITVADTFQSIVNYATELAKQLSEELAKAPDVARKGYADSVRFLSEQMQAMIAGLKQIAEDLQQQEKRELMYEKIKALGQSGHGALAATSPAQWKERCNRVWTTSTEIIEAVKALEQKDFIDMLNKVGHQTSGQMKMFQETFQQYVDVVKTSIDQTFSMTSRALGKQIDAFGTQWKLDKDRRDGLKMIFFGKYAEVENTPVMDQTLMEQNPLLDVNVVNTWCQESQLLQEEELAEIVLEKVLDAADQLEERK